MKLIFFGVLILLHVLTFLWYFLIRKDVWSYARTQAKILGEKNAQHIQSAHVRFTLIFYAVTLITLSVAFSIYFLQLTL